jgi:hypothetical protein
MKYGRELQENVFAPWRLSYMAYDVLKMELKSRQEDHPWTTQDESDIIQVSTWVALSHRMPHLHFPPPLEEKTTFTQMLLLAYRL